MVGRSQEWCSHRASGGDSIPTSPLEKLADQAKSLIHSDARQPDGMPITRAVALQSLFAGLTERALAQPSSPYFQELMRLGLKAQSQCRSTLQALAALKAPPSIYAQQANVTSGPQQINNQVCSANSTITTGKGRRVFAGAKIPR